MHTEHDCGTPFAKNEKALLFAFSLTFIFLLIEFAAGLMLNSLALIADAAHMLTDATALAISFAATRIARSAPDYRRTYGYYRFEILSATFNALLLFAIAFYIFYETYQRLFTPAGVASTGMFIVAAIGCGINLVTLRLLSVSNKSNLNIKSAYLEVWSDLLSSLAVMVGAVIIYYSGWTWVDPILAIVIALWILPRTWNLLKESLNILLEGTPEGIALDNVIQAIKTLPGVIDIHDLHLWVLSSNKNILTVHVVHDTTIDPAALIHHINQTLAEQFHVNHTTIQMERIPCHSTQAGCYL